MFKTIARLLFGGEEQTHEDVKACEVVEEEWLVVSHQEQSTEQTDTRLSDPALHVETVSNMENDVSAFVPEPTDHSSSTTSGVITTSVAQSKALVEAAQLICIQKAKPRAERHHMTRNAIQRQNRVRQGVHHNFFHLQQPGHRNLSH